MSDAIQPENRTRVPGFSGTITNTSLPDVIQLICISRNSCRMTVKSGSKKGIVVVRDGEIIHAEATDVTGEDAFYEIVSWELGVFECDNVRVESETIHESWDFLLIESMRRLETLAIS
jgi:two-component system, chemotaxis family, protein-glutamate methylesterase/glutaminase